MNLTGYRNVIILNLYNVIIESLLIKSNNKIIIIETCLYSKYNMQRKNLSRHIDRRRVSIYLTSNDGAHPDYKVKLSVMYS